MKFIVAADTQLGLYSHFSNIKNKSEIRTDSKEFVKLDFLNLKPTTSFDFEISKNINSDDEDEVYDPNKGVRRQGQKINVKKNRW